MVRSATRAVVLAALAVTLAAPTAQAAFPGSNGKIAYVRGEGEPHNGGSIAVIEPDGSNETVLTTHDYGTSADHDPAWSPDGRKIVFWRCCPAGGSLGIWVMNVDGSGQVRIASGYDPSWSPDGQRIVYERPGSGAYGYPNHSIAVANADGSNASSLPRPPCPQPNPPPTFPPQTRICTSGSPAWSPDGQKIAFATASTFCAEPDFGDPPFCNYEDSDLWLVNANGTGVTSLTAGGEDETDPNWSPDGEWLAFESAPPDPDYFEYPDDISIVRPDGTGRTNLTNSEGHEGNPAWSPDGREVAFEQNAEPTSFTDYRISKMDRAGGGATPLTPSTANHRFVPDWQPLGALNSFPRPGGGSPLLVPLVTAFEQCISPNSEHVAPLAQGSCTPPPQTSELLTTSRDGQGQGFVRLDVMAGNPVTPADEADIRIEASGSDVRNASDQSDYAGQVLVSSTLRISDRASGFGGVSGTVSDFRFDVAVTCTPTAVTPKGSDCQILTTADTLVPGMVAEGKRSVVSSFNFHVLDAGLDGDVSAPSCPPSCGTGDEQRYLEQGIFTP